MTHTVQGRILAALLVCLACAASARGAGPGETTPYRAETKRLRRLEVQALEVLWRQQPVAATTAGVHRYDDRLATWSSRVRSEQLREIDDVASQIDHVDDSVLRADDRVDRAAVLATLAVHRLELTEVQSWERDPLLYAEECVRGIHSLVARRGVAARKRSDAARKRLAEIPRVVAEMHENLRRPDPAMARAGADAFADGAEGLRRMIGDLARQAGRTPGADGRSALDAAVQAMQEAAQSLRALGEERSPAGMGRETYERFVRTAFSADCDADSLLRLATHVLRNAPPGDSGWSDARGAAVQAAPASFGRSGVLAAYREAVEGARRATLRRRVASVPDSAGEVALAELPSYLTPYVIEPVLDPIAPFDQPNPGERGVTAEHRRIVSTATLYIPRLSSAPSDDERQRWYDASQNGCIDAEVVPWTYPGAHLQITIAAQQVDPVRKALRSATSVAGWPAYCEELAIRRGALDAAAQIAIHATQRVRACRAIGEIHVQRGEWSVTDAAGFLAEQAGIALPTALRMVLCDLHRPGNATGALLGVEQILALRERYRLAHRDDYSLRRFHDAFLECGALPVSLLDPLLLP